MAAEKELAQNLAAANDSSPLSEEELAKVAAIRKELGTQFCRRCNYCAPCTVGISIPSVFLFQGYLDRYGLADWAKGRYATLSKTASDCIGCGACAAICPPKIDIPGAMKALAEKMKTIPSWAQICKEREEAARKLAGK